MFAKKYTMKKPLLITLILTSLCLNAQETEKLYSDIITDRPDQTESPFLVPKNLLQVETGFLYSESSEGGFTEKESVYNSTLLRYGLIDNLELRLGLEVLELKTISGTETETSVSGTSPLYAGFKIGVAEENGLLPQIGFLGEAFLPFSASEEFQPKSTGGDFRFAFSHTLSKKFDFSYNFGISWDGENPSASYVYSAVLGYAFTEKLSGFVEIYGDFPEETQANHLFDAGLTYLISGQLQIDLAGGTGLNTAQDFFIGAGISVRLPK
jgi:hypothetical protein